MPLPFLHPFAPTTKERFITLTRGRGATVWDVDGNELIDAMASLWYCQIGHGREEMADVAAHQMRQLEAYSCFDPFTNEPAEQLAARIAELTPIAEARVFFASSGSEAVDTAMKLSRLAQRMAGHPERHLIISRERGYHGTNLGGTSAQGLPPNKEGYGSLVPDVEQVPADDTEALGRLMSDRAGEIAAVLLEPVQGAAGVYPPPPGYLAEARRLCDEHGAYLIFDEVITGFGRLGRWFAAEHFGVTPDVTTFAKGVSSGYQPVGGVIVGAGPRAALEQDGFILRHGYTYSGPPTACATAREHIAVTEARKINIPIMAVVDTNCDPDLVDYAIPGNDDAIRAGQLMSRVISDAVQEGRFIRSKRLETDGDAGPNTGGMGAYSPVPIATEAIVDDLMADAVDPTLTALRKRGIDYRGVLFAGLMLTADGLHRRGSVLPLKVTVDEALAKYADKVDIHIHKDGSVSVRCARLFNSSPSRSPNSLR